uniref:Si:dkey-6i22.5 n=1 Tax=Neogobius melanostomus TaxID=47308 RepID=A0A8C6TGD8_9GOBI
MEQQDEVVISQEAENKAVVEQETSEAKKTSTEKSKSKSETTTTEDNAVAGFSRLKLFEKVMQKSLESFVGNVSFNKFTSTFRPLYDKNPQRMENIYKQFIEELRRAIQDDISRLIEEGRLKTKLNELDELQNASKREADSAWRPSGIPEQDLCSFLMPYYQKQDAYMRVELKKIQAENATLAQKVMAGRERISQTEHHISAAVGDWKASVTEFEKLASTLCRPFDAVDANCIKS